MSLGSLMEFDMLILGIAYFVVAAMFAASLIVECFAHIAKNKTWHFCSKYCMLAVHISSAALLGCAYMYCLSSGHGA